MHNNLLGNAAHELAIAAAEAGLWVTEVQQNAVRVASEAPSLIDTTRRIENAARKLERWAAHVHRCLRTEPVREIVPRVAPMPAAGCGR